MSFEKVNYIDGETVITAKNLNDIQNELTDLKQQLNEAEEDLSSIINNGGIPHTQKSNFANAIRNEIAFVSATHPYADAFLSWLESGSDTPVTPPTPEEPGEPTAPTLASITVTWLADSADVGTDTFTLISSVKANYSDGSSTNVTGYVVTPSVLAEGSQTVTVTYQGKSATKQITGNVVQNLWYESGTPLSGIEWHQGYINGSGVIDETSTGFRYADIRCDGVDHFEFTNLYGNTGVFFLDDDDTIVGAYATSQIPGIDGFVGGGYTINKSPVNRLATKVRVQARVAAYETVSVTPYKDKDVVTLSSASAGEIVNVAWKTGGIDASTGLEKSGDGIITDFCEVGNATEIKTTYKARSFIFFYDEDKEYLSKYDLSAGSNGNVASVPSGAKYFRYYSGGSNLAYSIFVK